MYYHSLKRINLIQNGPFRGCSELVGGGGGGAVREGKAPPSSLKSVSHYK